ncbi:MAG: TPM domain-containing protein [Bacteroidetes bacterium]|jgi:uncharacterized membrane protein|nr:TPM domain-containing protein [Bacteroidota bacterium]MDA0931668.1 TPM domain-containing protein [Bacteroidota bacterium]
MSASFLSETDQQRVIEAIQQAERHTDGEIKIHLEPTCSNVMPLARAKELFLQLNLQNTEQRSAVLIYIAYEDHQLAILGDSGIHQRVGDSFWQQEKDTLIGHFKAGDPAGGLVRVVHDVGQKLMAFFPKSTNNPNEISDDLSFGE